MRSRTALLLAVTALAGPPVAVAAPADAPPPGVLRPAPLVPLAPQTVAKCRRFARAAHVALLCPRRLPRSWVGPPGFPPPRLTADRVLARGVGQRPTIGVDFHYGFAWEPSHGPGWRRHLWRNRPCCFLHFEVYRRPDRRPVPWRARPAVLGGRPGLLLAARGYGISAPGHRGYWANHHTFFWRERRTNYVASLHLFGPGTRALLDRLVAELRPVRVL